MRTFVATAPDGTEMTRTSKTRVYTHAVLCYGVAWNRTEPSWGALAYSGSAKLAETEARRWRRMQERNGSSDEIIVVAVEEL